MINKMENENLEHTLDTLGLKARTYLEGYKSCVREAIKEALEAGENVRDESTYAIGPFHLDNQITLMEIDMERYFKEFFGEIKKLPIEDRAKTSTET